MRGLRYQPQGRLRVEARNPLADGLLSAQVGGSIGPHVNGPAGRYVQGVAFSVARDPGIPITNAAQSSGVLSNSQAFTFASLVRRINPGGSAHHFAMRYRAVGNVNNTIISLGVAGGTNGASISFSVSGTTGVTVNIGAPPAGGDTLLIVGVWDKSNDLMRLYVNGNLAGSAAIGSATITHATGQGIVLADSNSSNVNTGCLPYLTYVWPKRALTESENRRLATNPWQLFAAPDSEDGSQAFVSGSSTLAVTPAVLLLGGGSVAMRVSRRMAADAATLALHAGAATVRASRSLAVSPAAMVSPGGALQFQFAPSMVVRDYMLPVSLATMSMADGNVALRISRRLHVEAANFTLADHAINFEGISTGRPIDALAVSAARTVVFSGGKRAVAFNGGIRVVDFGGGIRTVRF